MSEFYDRKGNPITLQQWGKLLREDTLTRVVARSLVHDDLGEYLVSTVWLGMNHQYGAGPPLIFETMIFLKTGPDSGLNEDQWRYATEEQAALGHAEAVTLVRTMMDLRSTNVVEETLPADWKAS